MKKQEQNSGYNFGTFSGVLTPSVLTIFGLIMFLRTSEVVGTAGVYNALIILGVAQLITLSTGLSLSAISTNTKVEGGGVYFLISRTLGTAFGGSIGVTLFLAQALSIPFYILGFSESFIKTFSGSWPWLSGHVLAVNLVTTGAIFFLAWVGAKWALKAQILILIILGLAITAFLAGAAVNFSSATLDSNWESAPDFNMFTTFALFFPAVTGIMAGVNMSGDLKDPQKSIPRGSLLAILIATIVYGAQMLLSGGAFSRELLINDPYMVLVNNAIFGCGFLVVAGVFAATSSSAIGSFLGAPRVLQALSIDKIYRILNPFKKGSGEENEPRRALLLSLLITLGIIFWAGRSLEKGGGVDAVSSIVTMFFLYTYGMVNVAAFVESFGSNPSFRPRFKFYHWSTALFGAVACFFTSFMIDWHASTIALISLVVLYFLARKNALKQSFGDAQRGFVYSRIRNNLVKLSTMQVHPKNWRPTIAVLTGNLESRLSLAEFGVKFEGQKGIVSIVQFIVGDTDQLLKTEIRQNELKRMKKLIAEKELNVFPEVLVTPDFDAGLLHFLQCHSIGPIKPNIIMQGWPRDNSRVAPFMKHISTIQGLGMSNILYLDLNHCPLPAAVVKGTIDIWWRGKSNGSLMLLLAYLLQTNPCWKRTKIRIIRTVQNDDASAPALQSLKDIIHAARIEAEAKVVVSDNFDKALHSESKDAKIIFMGFLPPSEENYNTFYETTTNRLKNLPPTFLVNSSGDADFLA